MEDKDKASDLVCDFYQVQSNEYDYGINWEMAKQCSLVAVDEIIKALNDDIYIQGETDIDSHVNYWQRVKQEIQNL